jgi:hypothetical protein
MVSRNEQTVRAEKKKRKKAKSATGRAAIKTRPTTLHKQAKACKIKNKKSTKRGSHCLPKNQCKHNGSGSGDMVRCIFCNHWYHCDCTDADITLDEAWTCTACRRMPQDIHNLQLQLKDIIQVNTNLSQKCIEVVDKTSAVQAKYSAMQVEYSDLEHVSYQLKTELQKMTDKFNSKKSENEHLKKGSSAAERQFEKSRAMRPT